MKIKPINSTIEDTLVFSSASLIEKTSINKIKVFSDPKNEITNGAYGIIKGESIRLFFNLMISSFLTIASIITFILCLYIFNSGILVFFLLTCVILLSVFKLLITLVERNSLKKSVAKYREDLKIGLKSTPPFITNLYSKLHIRQISQNWFTFFIMFYCGIFTLILWGLKDADWWIFHFKDWTISLFGNPNLVLFISCICLILTIVIYIIFTSLRRKRIYEIDTYFGLEVISRSVIEEMKSNKNKWYRRFFIATLLVLLLIPVLIKLVKMIMKRFFKK